MRQRENEKSMLGILDDKAGFFSPRWRSLIEVFSNENFVRPMFYVLIALNVIYAAIYSALEETIIKIDLILVKTSYTEMQIVSVISFTGIVIAWFIAVFFIKTTAPESVRNYENATEFYNAKIKNIKSTDNDDDDDIRAKIILEWIFDNRMQRAHKFIAYALYLLFGLSLFVSLLSFLVLAFGLLRG